MTQRTIDLLVGIAIEIVDYINILLKEKRRPDTRPTLESIGLNAAADEFRTTGAVGCLTPKVSLEYPGLSNREYPHHFGPEDCGMDQFVSVQNRSSGLNLSALAKATDSIPHKY